MATSLAREPTPDELDDDYLDSHTKSPRALYAYQERPDYRDQEAWEPLLAGYIRSGAEDIHGGIGSRWRGIKPLGKGGQGMAGLWERRDIQGRVAEVCRPSHSVHALL